MAEQTATPPETVEGSAEEMPPEVAPQPVALAPEHGTDLVARPQGTTELIAAETAAQRVEIATEIATALDAVIKAQGMRTKVGRTKKVHADGREEWVDKWHVNVEGWQTLALLLGLAVIPHDPEPIRDDAGRVKLVDYTVERLFYPKGTTGQEIKSGQAQPERVERAQVTGTEGYRCRVEVFKDGVLIGAGNGRCDRTEEAWRDRPEYALEGMAATRAQSRAIAATARWIVTLAGYSATPAEEMPAAGDDAGDAPAPALPEWAAPAPAASVEKLRQVLGYLLRDDPNGERVNALGADLLEDAEGKITKVAARAIMRVGSARKKLDEAARAAAAPEGEPIPAEEVQQHAEERKVKPDHAPPPLSQRPRAFEGDPDAATTTQVLAAIDAGRQPTPGCLKHLSDIPAAVQNWCSCKHAGRPGEEDQCLVHGIPF